MNEDRLFRALERIEARQHEHTERLVAVETKMDDLRADGEKRDIVIDQHSTAIEQARGITKLVGGMATTGFLGGLLAALKAWLWSSPPQ